MEHAILTALEIGTSRIRALVGESVGDDHIAILGYGETASRGVRKGEIIDLDNASACVRTAIHNAEVSSDISIPEVFMLVSGAQIQGVVNHGELLLPQGAAVTEEDAEHVMEAARAMDLPADRETLHTIRRRFQVDGQRGVTNPVGMDASRLGVDMLILHGLRQRVRNLGRAAVNAQVEIVDIAFGGLCSALAVLSPEDKEHGALVIDLGAGTTDYVVYADGAIAAAGSFAVGGDHLTNDLARALRIALGPAEALKEQAGSAVIDLAARGQKIEIPSEGSSVARYARLGDIHTVTNARAEEILSLVRRALEPEDLLHYLGAGVFLTGGGAYLRGYTDLASRVFGLPCVIGRPRDVSGMATGPEFAAPAGMLRYALRTYAREDAEPSGLGSLVKRLFGRGRA